MDEYILTKKSTLTQIANSIRAAEHSDASILVTDLASRFSAVASSVQSINNAYALILVEYPAGSTCTCSNGSTTLVAGNDYGAWIFGVPNSGAWTVQSYTGSNYESSNYKANKIVNISSARQIERVEVFYRLYLFDYEQGGVINSEISNGFTIIKGSGAAAEITSERMRIRNTDTSGQVIRVMTANKINMTKYTSLNIVCTRTGTGEFRFGFALANTSSDRTKTLDVYVNSKQVENTPVTISCPIESLDSYYVGVQGAQAAFDVNIYKMWLE